MRYSEAKAIINQHGEATRLLAEHQRRGTVETIRLAKMRLEALEKKIDQAHAVVDEWERARDAERERAKNEPAAREAILTKAKQVGLPGDLEAFADAVLRAATDHEVEVLAGGVLRVGRNLIVSGRDGVEERVREALKSVPVAPAPTGIMVPKEVKRELDIEKLRNAGFEVKPVAGEPLSGTMTKGATMGTTESMASNAPSGWLGPGHVLPPPPELRSDRGPKRRKWR